MSYEQRHTELGFSLFDLHSGNGSLGSRSTGPARAGPAGRDECHRPKIQFETTVHDFGRAKCGDQVKYTYIFTNVGDQLLELSGVQACGCITANWTKKVEPGQTGAVPIGFNSANYNGPVIKTITVTCNDRTNPRPMLQFKGTVWKPIEVSPQLAVLNLTRRLAPGLRHGGHYQQHARADHPIRAAMQQSRLYRRV